MAFTTQKARKPRWTSVLLVAAVVGTGAQGPALGQPAVAARAALDALTLHTGVPVEARFSRRSGLVTFLSAPAESGLPVEGAGPEERARGFLADHGALFGLRGGGELVTERVRAGDQVGMDHVRLRQTVGGVPVTGGEVGVHLRGDAVVAVHARTVAVPPGLVTTPALPREAARELARAALSRDFDPDRLTLSAGRLEILDRAHLGAPPAPVRLAWFFEAWRLDVDEVLWIDAELGAVLLRFSRLASAKHREIYDAEDPSDGMFGELPGTLVRSEGEGDTGDLDADDAYRYSGDTYDYYLGVHGRDSFDDAGGDLVSTVHFCPDADDCPYGNAAWNPALAQMIYGDGFPAADDVAAHELTHAVTQLTADLFYYGQSGALNESYSDVFGETVDLGNGSGNDTSAVRWLVGEDLPGLGPQRNMMDPQEYGDPGKLSEVTCLTSEHADHGGVHVNSGVPNHAYALLVDGGLYNGTLVFGIGLDKAGRVYYRALSEYLLSSSDFADAAAALQQACSDLVGTAGITALNCFEVGYALEAVEMADPWPCGQPAASPPLCAAGEVATDLFFDDFEELAGEMNDPALLTHWTQAVLAGEGHWDEPVPVPGLLYSTSGTGSAYGFDLGATADSALEMVGDVAIPTGGAYARFDHAWGFDFSVNSAGVLRWDGGVLERSVDGGATWQDAGGLVSAGAGYNGAIVSPTNPLVGRSAFTVDSFGLTASKLDLASLAGEDLRFRFRIGSDSSIADVGWFVDDFRIYTCSSGCTPTITLTSGTVTGVESHVACTSITAGTAYGVAATGDLTLTAPLVILTDGFHVEAGGVLAVATD